MNSEPSEKVIDPASLRQAIDKLRWRRSNLQLSYSDKKSAISEIDEFLVVQPKIAERLEALSKDLFGEILDEVEVNLSYAIKEVLGQDLKVVSNRDVQRGKVTISFGIERDGQPEDILTGQGGSVCNIISVGLRLIALSQLDEREHRRFLILDEQDCWIRPDLVPRLMSIIHAISYKLDFQVLVISHHDVSLFREYADRVYRIVPEIAKGAGATVELMDGYPPLLS